MKKKLNTEQFIEKAKQVHGDKYDYSKVNYKGSKEKICIICPEHGEFQVIASNHLRGYKCPQCNKPGRKKFSKNEFVNKANIVHNYKYDYSKFEYNGSKTKGVIICPIHGEFEQTADSHLQGSGCPICGKINTANKNRKSLDEFIKYANIIHKNKYDYSKVIFNSNKDRIEIICPIHGSFYQILDHHMRGCGCPKCAGRNNNTEDFLRKSKIVHNELYNYSKTKYVDYKTPVTIICRNHGEFKQLPNVHLRGSGCPICNYSKGELFIKNILDKNNIRYEKEYKIDDSKYWDNIIRVDFAVQYDNKLHFIEYNGIQHYIPIDYFGGELRFNQQKNRDNQLRLYCKDKNIPLFEIKYDTKLDDDLVLKIMNFIYE